MKIVKFAIFMSLFGLYGCEIFVIGTRQEFVPTVNLTQDTPLGAVFLFKAELDSNNVPAAAQLLARHDGTRKYAIERYESYFDVARLKRLISMRPVTRVKIDTLSTSKFVYKIEYDYTKHVAYTTTEINKQWFIVDYNPYDEPREPFDINKFMNTGKK